MSEKFTDEDMYNMYGFVACCEADEDAVLEVASHNGLDEDEVRDAIDRHRLTIGKRPFWSAAPEGWEATSPGEEITDGEVAEDITDKVMHDMVVYGKTLAGMGHEESCQKAADFLKLSKAKVKAAFLRHESTYRR